MTLLEKELDRYVRQFSSPEDPLLKELDRQTHLYTVHPRMSSGHIQGMILQMLVRMYRPVSILEIGTFTGYSAICMARAAGENCVLHTIDINDELERIPASFIARAGLEKRIVRHIGRAQDIVPGLGLSFDMVFIDGDKREYPEYYDLLLDNGYVHSGSVILGDNVLWDGKVVDDSPKNLKDAHTAAIKRFNEKAVSDERVETVIMPFRDGMSIIYVK